MKTEETTNALEWLDQQRDAVLASEEGCDVEYLDWDDRDREWRDVTNPSWRFDRYSYRRKPKPELTAERREVMDLHKIGFTLEAEVHSVPTYWIKCDEETFNWDKVNYRINPYQLSVYRAWQAGKKIEYFNRDTEMWLCCTNNYPCWDWEKTEYRIAREPKTDVEFWRKAVELGAKVECRCGKDCCRLNKWHDCTPNSWGNQVVEYRFAKEEK